MLVPSWYKCQPEPNFSKTFIPDTQSWMVRNPGKPAPNDLAGEGGVGDTNALVSRNHNQQAKGTQLISVEGGREGTWVHGPTRGLLIKLPFPNVFKGEG